MAPPVASAMLKGAARRKEDKPQGGSDGDARQQQGQARRCGGGGGSTATGARPSTAAPPSPPPPPAASSAAADDHYLPTREIVKPANQLALSAAALAEEVPRMLCAANPVAPHNIVRFSARERCFKFEPISDHTAVHYAADGCLLHGGSDEARRQAEAACAAAEAAAAALKADAERVAASVSGEAGEQAAAATASSGSDHNHRQQQLLRNQFNFGERAAQTAVRPPRSRGTMTEPPPTATASGSCSPWEVYDAYAADLERQRAEEAARATTKGGAGGSGDRQQRGGAAATPAGACASGGGGSAPTAATAVALDDALRVLDRMALQNAHEDVAADFKFYDDGADALRPGEGTLLPLWQFRLPLSGSGGARKKHVTGLAWSPTYADLFAASYGSFDAQRQGRGAVAAFSLKNPARPEFGFATDAGVTALAFHPHAANLLAVGCYDGSVAVYDVRRHRFGRPACGDSGDGGGAADGGDDGGARADQAAAATDAFGASAGVGSAQLSAAAPPATGVPLYRSSATSGHHGEPVWQVVWQQQQGAEGGAAAGGAAAAASAGVGAGALQFVSVSSDGDVVQWTLVKSGALQREPLMRLRPLEASGGASSGGGVGAENGAGGDAAGAAVGAMCIDFAKAPPLGGVGGQQQLEYLVGAEDGSVRRCTKAYARDGLSTHAPANTINSGGGGGGGGSVYAVAWNPLHPHVFLSAAADWRVRVWDVREGGAGAAAAAAATAAAANGAIASATAAQQPAPPLLELDLGAPVGDAAWAPGAATLLAAAADDGRVSVYDLAASAAAPLCAQRVTAKGRLTRLAFSDRHPTLLVGDSRGVVHALKLSPNLRPGNGRGAADPAAERARLDAVIELARKRRAPLV